MKRRTAVKGLILFSLGTGMIFSCKDKYKAIRDLNLDHFQPTNEELDIIEAISSIIVPLNSIPELENHTPLPFIFTMLDDIYTPKDREAFLEGYKSFDGDVEVMESRKFSDMDKVTQTMFLNEYYQDYGSVQSRMLAFLDIIKRESIHYLKSSEYYQRKVNYYEMAPGRFKGNVLISDLKNANKI